MFDTAFTTNPPSSTWINVANVTSTLAANVADLNATQFWNISDDGGIDKSNDSELLNTCHPQNVNFNCSVEDFLSYHLGSKQMPLETAIWVSKCQKIAIFIVAPMPSQISQGRLRCYVIYYQTLSGIFNFHRFISIHWNFQFSTELSRFFLSFCLKLQNKNLNEYKRLK